MQGLRAALNAALFRTGDQSRDFAVVLATNRPADLDPAVLDRMDEALEFPLPGPAERATILQLYIDSYIAKAGTREGVRTASAHATLLIISFILILYASARPSRARHQPADVHCLLHCKGRHSRRCVHRLSQFCPAWIRPASSLTSQRQAGLQWSCIAAYDQVRRLIGLML